MSETIQKELMVSEADPATIDEHRLHEPGSFLDMYRSLATEHIHTDMEFVDQSVRSHVVPEAVRYGVMNLKNGQIYRGVVKAMDGSMHYFSWAPETEFKLIPADNPTKMWDAQKLFKSCSLGCDIRKAADAPIDPGEAVEEDAEDEKASAPNIWPAGTTPRPEDQFVAQQDTTVAPGSMQGTTPDDPNVGREWHAKSHQGAYTTTEWDTSALMKAWGRKLQQSAPGRVEVNALEARYMREVLGATETQIQKGMRIPPRHHMAYETWKSDQLRGTLNGLKDWLRKQDE